MDWLTNSFYLGLTFFGIGTFVYYLFRREERRKKVTQQQQQQQQQVRGVNVVHSVKSYSVEIRVPKTFIGNIVGRNGTRIREIQTASDTRIFFKDLKQTPNMRICVIRGSQEGVELAEKLVHDAILNYPSVNTAEVFVPLRMCSLFVGRYGESVRWIRRLTRSKIVMDNWCFHNNYSTRKVYIKGSPEQIERAKNFIAQKVEEDDQPPITPSGTLPVPTRRRMAIPYMDDLEDDFSIHMDDVFATGNNGLLEVFVASVENPSKFWIQIMGPNVLNVDKLANDMTDFYEKAQHRRSHELVEVSVGKIIAVPFIGDNRWYRGEITKVYPHDSNDKETKVDVFYVDFGDVGTFRKREAFELNDMFMSMRFQAIECCLANVKPRDTWTEEAIDLFKRATCGGIWKTISAKIIEYKCPPRGHHKRNLPIPRVQLVDTTHPMYLDVAYELVRLGHAEWTLNG